MTWWRLPFISTVDLGTIWRGAEASQAARSLDGGENLRVCFRNLSRNPNVLLCWIDASGTPHHFHRLPPTTSKSASLITTQDHAEQTYLGHAFAIVASSDVDATLGAQSLDGPEVTWIGGYRPEQLHSGWFQSKRDKEYPVHLVTVHEEQFQMNDCCGPAIPYYLRGRRGEYESNKKTDEGAADPKDDVVSKWTIQVRPGNLDISIPYDTTNKVYNKVTCEIVVPADGKSKDKEVLNWTLHVEDNWNHGNKEIERILFEDLREAVQLLPPHARRKLCETTPIWLNHSLKYGPKAAPITGRHMCFHPGEGWLKDNGCSTEKCHGIELFRGTDYDDSRECWEPGGLMLHELSHAYHCVCIKDGYDNKEILQCFRDAMRDGLYKDPVPVHGSQGPKALHYARTNDKEYWAELSVAYLGGRGDKENVEFNKWFPFNRKQLKEHDPRAYELLKKLWKD